jgi:aldehyde dehydrogenase (NAD+)
MTEQEIGIIFNIHRTFFDEGNTKSYQFRKNQLVNLRKAIKKFEPEIIEALHADMHKPSFESFISEIGFLYAEIKHTLEHLEEWMEPETVDTPLALQISSSKIYSEPLGVVLLIGPWNYPFQLLMAPLVGAIAGGNCSILKPSDNTKHTAKIIEKLVKETFDEKFVSVIQGPGSIIGPMLIEKYRFDHIFFTGSAKVGKQIMKMASEHLTPVTLELGGKSPVIVDKDVNIDIAAKRLVWAKCFNAGQTCVGPDYLLVHESIKDKFVKRMIHWIKEFFGENPLESEYFTHIVNTKRFEILLSYLKNVNILHGGKSNADTLCIEPTLVDGIPEGHPIMQEEIFGPVLPFFTFKDLKEIVPIIRRHRYPLSCYVFTNNKSTEKFVIENIEFGGGCINNALAHLANPDLPFGGVGYSGMGNYHGKNSFDVFSHKKSVLKTKFFFDPSLRYPPYTKLKNRWLHYFFR